MCVCVCVKWFYLVLNYVLFVAPCNWGSTAETRGSTDCFIYIFVCVYIYIYTLYVHIVVFNNMLRKELVN